MEQTKNILVTGGCGFIGSNFVRGVYKNHPNYKIWNLDMLTYAGNLENLADIEKEESALPADKKRYTFIEGDVANRELLTELFEKHRFDLIFHFAAETHVDRSFHSFTNFIRANVEGTMSLASMVIKYGGRMVHVSTDEVYGSIPEGFVDENAPFWPSNPYASSKAAADILLQSFIKTFAAPIIIVRGTNNYGPYQYPEKLLPLSITNLLEEKKIPVHGNGMHLRQWIHVEDFTDAIDLISQKGEDGDVYNIAGEHETNIGALEMIAKHLGKNLDDFKYFTPDRPGADYRYAIDSSKLEKNLGWKRKHTFKESLPVVIEWYKKNEAWWRKLREKKEFQHHYEKQSQAKWH
ncbi:MAG: dTDP-glucose 4,6-dehydratase [Candidatus Paceibacterota bacterium]|jgi:dTDP-glucose 4,6-dehydratase